MLLPFLYAVRTGKVSQSKVVALMGRAGAVTILRFEKNWGEQRIFPSGKLRCTESRKKGKCYYLF